MAIDLSKLNSEQQEAVLHGSGPLLIVAGAGTGKTTVITQRIASLIDQGLARPEEILALTFTEKAASEMEERVDRLLRYGYVDLWISTFHAFCERILRTHALDIGLSPDFKLLDGTAGWLLARQNLDKFELDYYKALGNPTKFIQALIGHFSHCKDQEIYPEEYLQYADDLKTTDNGSDEPEAERVSEVANAYHTYQQILLENNCLDFGDLINYCLKLFKKRPKILEKYRAKFKYILVDEFQDTNYSQYELIKLLASPANNLTVCADDDQAIYRWRGASFSNIMQFKNDFAEAKQVSLVRNYRSCQNILDTSYEFIKQNNPDRLECVAKISKKLISGTDAKGVIEHMHAKTLDKEVGEVVRKILEILKHDKESSYNDFAVLVRANDHAQPFIRGFERAGLPYQFLASRGLYSKPVILDVVAYFKLLDNYHEGTATYRILNLPFLQIAENDVATISLYAHKKTKSLFEALQGLELISGLTPKTKEDIAFLLAMVQKHTALAKTKSAAEVFVAFLNDSGYLKYLIKNNENEKIDLLNQFLKKIKSFEESALDPSLKNFMEQMTMELEAGEEGKLEFDPEQGPDMIKVMTIHGAKGLEFKYVFVVNMVDKRFPSISRSDPIELPDELIKDIKPTGDVHLQEERRLFYVAMTRAKKHLYFTSADDYGGKQRKKLSRFLAELGYKQEEPDRASGVKEKGTDKGEALAPAKREILARKVATSFLPDHFSFSQLEAFEKCPLQYKFGFILKVPTNGKAVFSFGHTVHNTLAEFLTEVNKIKPGQKDLFGAEKKNKFDLKFMNELFERNWVDEWYDSKKQKEEYYKLGKRIVKDFYDEFEKNPPKVLMIKGEPAIETGFNLKIGDYTIKGKIDRIDDLGQGSVALIDYKTGASKDKPKKDQLLIYQMAASEVLHLEPKQLSFYYLEDGKQVSFIGSEAELQAQKEKVIEMIGQIKDSNFEPKPGWECQYCDFKDICDHAER